MTRTLIFAVAFSYAAAAATPPRTYVDEDFEGGQFPPAGWWTSYWGSGLWQLREENGNHYARGSAAISGIYTARAHLRVGYFSLNNGRPLQAKFLIRAGSSGTPQYFLRQFYLLTRTPSSGHFWYNIRAAEQWTPVDFNVPVKETRGDYYFGWLVGVTNTLYSASIWLEIDDILIKENNTGVNPSSLGRVKTLYR